MNQLRITSGAYSWATHDSIEKYLAASQGENERVQTVLRFALLCVLEVASFTGKAGQYLRWDHRSGRTQGKKPFDKGHIPTFEQANSAKLEEILLTLPRTIIKKVCFRPKKLWGNSSPRRFLS